VAIQYIMTFDGIRAAALLADFISARKESLGAILGRLPALHYRRTTVPCAWQEKGRVLRELTDLHREDPTELNEGIKILGDRGWALILPDSEKPQVNIFTEGYNEEYAQELSTEFADKVNSLLSTVTQQKLTTNPGDD